MTKSWVSAIFLLPLRHEMSSAQLTFIYVHITWTFQIPFCCSYLQLFYYILMKSLLHIHPNLTFLYKIYISYKFCWLLWQFLPIMLAICLMLLLSYYYAGIIGSSLLPRMQVVCSSSHCWIEIFSAQFEDSGYLFHRLGCIDEQCN